MGSISETAAVKLSEAALGSLPTHVTVPNYNRRELSAGIVHFGAGNFHRAHQETYLDELFAQGMDLDWAVVGAGVMSADRELRDKLAAQDFLTTVVQQDPCVNRVRVIGSMVDFLPVGDPAAVIRRLCDPAVRIVSLTITEGGYFLNSAENTFDSAHPAIIADSQSPNEPRTVFGLIVAALRERKAADVPPFTVLSCDNIPHNGLVARNAVVGLAALSDAQLAEWIAENVAFPSGMVDRITPVTGERERRLCVEEHGIEDGWPVFCEGFKQWVLEDRFPSGRPRLERVGVQFVPDVAPYELMKLRILNGGHSALAYISALLGIQFAHEALANRLVRAFLRRLEQQEIIPSVPPPPGCDLNQYFDVVEQRFANPKIADTIRRLCQEGSSRQPKFIVPTIVDRVGQGKSVHGLALACALWCRYCYGTTEEGTPIEPNDTNWTQLNERARLARQSPLVWLEMEEVYGGLGQSPVFAAAFSQALSAIWRDGVEQTVRQYVHFPAEEGQKEEIVRRPSLFEIAEKALDGQQQSIAISALAQ